MHFSRVKLKGFSGVLHAPIGVTSERDILFSVSVRGLVTCVQDEIVSQSGNPMRNFRLQDEAGRYVQCVACGLLRT